MSSFRFGLQRVLDLRERQEQERARVLAEAERRVAEAEAHLQRVQEIQGEETEKLLRVHASGSTVGQLRNLSAVIRQLTDQVAAAEQAVREASRRVEESRAQLVTSMQDRRILDQLRTRQAATWRQEQAGLEQKLMDELALSAHRRKAAQGGRS